MGPKEAKETILSADKPNEQYVRLKIMARKEALRQAEVDARRRKIERRMLVNDGCDVGICPSCGGTLIIRRRWYEFRARASCLCGFSAHPYRSSSDSIYWEEES